MPYPFTVLIEVPQEIAAVAYEQRKADHDSVMAAYFRTFDKRALDAKTADRTQKILKYFFEPTPIRSPPRDPSGHILIMHLPTPFAPQLLSTLTTHPSHP